MWIFLQKKKKDLCLVSSHLWNIVLLTSSSYSSLPHKVTFTACSPLSFLHIVSDSPLHQPSFLTFWHPFETWRSGSRGIFLFPNHSADNFLFPKAAKTERTKHLLYFLIVEMSLITCQDEQCAVGDCVSRYSMWLVSFFLSNVPDYTAHAVRMQVQTDMAEKLSKYVYRDHTSILMFTLRGHTGAGHGVYLELVGVMLQNHSMQTTMNSQKSVLVAKASTSKELLEVHMLSFKLTTI